MPRPPSRRKRVNPILTVIIPAHNEEGYIGRCLASVLGQTLEPVPSDRPRIIVAANGCSDATVTKAEAMRPAAEDAGWQLSVLDIEEGGKPNALNRGDAAAGPMVPGDIRVYLDADIEMEPALLAQIAFALDQNDPAYASGRMIVTEAQNWVTRRFMNLWRKVPFMTTSGPTGAGLFAVNAAGRARWGTFPAIIADDTYVRLQFSPQERIEVAAAYFWPPVEGFKALVKVRRRQDAGGREIRALYPALFENEGKAPVRLQDHLRLFLGSPLDYAVYITVMLTVKFGPGQKQQTWSRGR